MDEARDELTEAIGRGDLQEIGLANDALNQAIDDYTNAVEKEDQAADDLFYAWIEEDFWQHEAENRKHRLENILSRINQIELDIDEINKKIGDLE